MLFRSQQVWNAAPYALRAHFPIKSGAVLFIVKWEICSNYCNSIVLKISRAWLTFSFQKSILVKKPQTWTCTVVSQMSAILGMSSPSLTHRTSQRGCKMCPEAQCTEMEPFLIIARRKPDRFAEILTKRLIWKSKCTVWYAGDCFPQENTFGAVVTWPLSLLDIGINVFTS